MRNSEITRKFEKARPKVKRPLSDDQQRRLNEIIDADLNKRIHMDPRDPRAMQYLQGALWLWR